MWIVKEQAILLIILITFSSVTQGDMSIDGLDNFTNAYPVLIFNTVYHES